MADAITPMMQQYQRLRGSVPADVLLLFRLGDFYELFFEDAKEAAGLLNVALTKRNGVPMCGVPYHAAQNYIAKLIKAGRRVAICDQTSEPQPGRIVTRDITQIISAGTVSELGLLEAKRANYLAAIYEHESASPVEDSPRRARTGGTIKGRRRDQMSNVDTTHSRLPAAGKRKC
jgi:DNA mismatch repair protein MutS